MGIAVGPEGGGSTEGVGTAIGPEGAGVGFAVGVGSTGVVGTIFGITVTATGPEGTTTAPEGTATGPEALEAPEAPEAPEAAANLEISTGDTVTVGGTVLTGGRCIVTKSVVTSSAAFTLFFNVSALSVIRLFLSFGTSSMGLIAAIIVEILSILIATFDRYSSTFFSLAAILLSNCAIESNRPFISLTALPTERTSSILRVPNIL